MSEGLARHHQLEHLLARVLDQGAWLASGVIAVGWIMVACGWHASWLINLGVALFLLLPVFRVLIMLVVFFRERDHRFSAITALVLSIILLGAVLGILRA